MISKSTISIDEVLVRTKAQLRLLNTSEQDDYLLLMINEGLRHLDALTLCVKRQCTLDIVDNKAELPKGFQKLLGMRFINTSLQPVIIDGVEVPKSLPSYSSVFYVDTAFLNNCNCSTYGFANYTSTAQIVNNTLHFNSNNIESGTIQVAFMGLNVNEEGQLLIYEEYERALSSYACYMFVMAYNDIYAIGLADRYYEIWKAQKAWIKGGAWKDEFFRTKKEISSFVNALVIDQRVN